jgi:hypothetical protein
MYIAGGFTLARLIYLDRLPAVPTHRNLPQPL